MPLWWPRVNEWTGQEVDDGGICRQQDANNSCLCPALTHWLDSLSVRLQTRLDMSCSIFQARFGRSAFRSWSELAGETHSRFGTFDGSSYIWWFSLHLMVRPLTILINWGGLWVGSKEEYKLNIEGPSSLRSPCIHPVSYLWHPYLRTIVP